MSEIDLIRAIDSIPRMERDKHEKIEYVKEKKEEDGIGFDILLKTEQARLKEISRIKKAYQEVSNEIHENIINTEEIESSNLNSK